MSAALLAIEHFNSRNSSVVPEIADFEECNVRFDINQSRVIDTGSVTHQASETMWEQDIVPCAMAGPFNDLPAIDLSVIALSAKIPLVAHRAHNLRITSDYLSPFSSQVFPGTLSSAHKVVEFLYHKGRTDFIGVLYSLTETGLQRQEALAIELDDSHTEWMSAGYSLDHSHEEGRGYPVECNGEYEGEHRGLQDHDECNNHDTHRAMQVMAFNVTFEDAEEENDDNITNGEENVFGEDHHAVGDMEDHDDGGDLEGEEHEDDGHGHDEHEGESEEHVDEHSVLGALMKIKDSGYRTIVVAMEFPDGEAQHIADAAEKLGMNEGEYFWVWHGLFEPALAHSKNSNMTKLLAGSAVLMAFSEAFLQPQKDPFAMAWSSQGKEAVDRLNAANPIEPGEVGYIFAEDDWFQTVELEWGSGKLLSGFLFLSAISELLLWLAFYYANRLHV